MIRLLLLLCIGLAALGGAVFYVLTVLPRTGTVVAVLEHPGAGDAALDLDLAPAMNPLRVTLDLTRHFAAAGNRLETDVTLVGPDGGGHCRARLRLADRQEAGSGTAVAFRPVAICTVSAAGRYRLVARLGGTGGVRRARYAVRRNVGALRAPWMEAALGAVGIELPGVFAPGR